jgi:hypothetical protein
MMRHDQPPVRRERQWGTNQSHHSQGLVDVLDRVLDKGLVIAGDIKIELAEVELLTIRIRLLVCSIDKAEEVGLDWWKYDPHLSSRPREQRPLMEENEALRKEIHELRQQVAQLAERSHAAPGRLPQSTGTPRSSPPAAAARTDAPPRRPVSSEATPATPKREP